MRSGRSRFSLSTLPANDFPNIEDWQSDVKLSLTQGTLRALIEKTQFSMANQDVRYYLNGMLFEIDGTTLRSVATDGHRMAVSQAQLDTEFAQQQIIVPRKGVLELMKLLDAPEQNVTLQIGSSNLRAEVDRFVFTSKLLMVVFLIIAELCLNQQPRYLKLIVMSCVRLSRVQLFYPMRSFVVCELTYPVMS